MLGVAQRGEPEERVDRRQPGVAGAGAVAALVFEVVEERGDQRRVEVLELERRRRLAGLLLGEGEQQPEGVAIGGDRVRAGALWLISRSVKNASSVGRERGHRRSFTVAFARVAGGLGPTELRVQLSVSVFAGVRAWLRAQSSGAADRYQ